MNLAFIRLCVRACAWSFFCGCSWSRSGFSRSCDNEQQSRCMSIVGGAVENGETQRNAVLTATGTPSSRTDRFVRFSFVSRHDHVRASVSVCACMME